MALPESYYAVLLHGRHVGTLCQRGDHTQFVMREEYLADPARPVLGLRFEEVLTRPYSSALRLPPWFSNLLPEGPLRQWVADDRGVSADREMELLAQVGHDLPGAVQVVATEAPETFHIRPPAEYGNGRTGSRTFGNESPWRFSLAGVALKFSMLQQGDRLTVPAHGERGDWLVKFPDQRFEDVPMNEHVMMSFARAVGIDVPEVKLLHRDELTGVPGRMWPGKEEWAYAVRRFDRGRDSRRTPVHIEDFAQVRDKYPQDKYEGSFETVAALSYRGHDVSALREMARRLAFSILIGNGDAHLKNWSLIYRDTRVPTLSPVYDLVSTVCYRDQEDGPEDLGLKFDGSKRFAAVRLSSFARLEARLDRRMGRTDAMLVDAVSDTVQRTRELWPRYREELAKNHLLSQGITEWLTARITALSDNR